MPLTLVDFSHLGWLLYKAADVTHNNRSSCYATCKYVVQILHLMSNIENDQILFHFWEVSVIKNLMTLIGYNTSANLDAIRSENLIKSKLTTTTDRELYFT